MTDVSTLTLNEIYILFSDMPCYLENPQVKEGLLKRLQILKETSTDGDKRIAESLILHLGSMHNECVECCGVDTPHTAG